MKNIWLILDNKIRIPHILISHPTVTRSTFETMDFSVDS